MTYLDRALEWINQSRVGRGLPTLAEWPENLPENRSLLDRSRTCPVAQALGAEVGMTFATFDGEDESQIVLLPPCVQDAVMHFDNELDVKGGG